MATADKLVYLDGTKDLLREALNLRGAEIDEGDTFRSYVAALQDIVWLPDALFSNGEQGVWYDPSDLSTMFQDAAGTIPVVGDGDPVGLILDKSGRGNHATQPAASSRPIYRNVGGLSFLEFDGADDFLVTTTINLTATNKVTVVAGLTKLRNAGREMICELSATAANPGTFNLDHSQSTSGAYAATLSTPFAAAALAPATAAPSTDVVSIQYDSSQSGITNEVIISRDGVVQPTTQLGNADSGSGNLGAHPLYIGRRGGASLAFQGDMYSLIVRAAATTPGLLASAQAYAAQKSGVAL